MIEDILKVISDFYNVDQNMILSNSRRKEAIRPRHVFMYILREDFSLSSPQIGEKAGGRDHTTILHAYRKIKNELENDSILSQEINQLRKNILRILPK